MTRTLLPVSAKVAIYNPEKTKVLLTEYLPGKYGLPGGHLEESENPSDAALRELFEEIGITLTAQEITPKSFWRHDAGKVVLAFTTTLPEDSHFILDPEEVIAVHWTPLTEIKDGTISTKSYDHFILSSL